MDQILNMAAKSEVIRLYRLLLRESNNFTNYNYRFVMVFITFYYAEFILDIRENSKENRCLCCIFLQYIVYIFT